MLTAQRAVRAPPPVPTARGLWPLSASRARQVWFFSPMEAASLLVPRANLTHRVSAELAVFVPLALTQRVVVLARPTRLAFLGPLAQMASPTKQVLPLPRLIDSAPLA